MLCSFKPSVDLLRVRHPLHQLLWRGAIGHQQSQDLLLGIRAQWYADQCLHFLRLNAYAIPCHPGVELPRSHHLAAFQSSSVSQRLPSSTVLGDGKRELDDQSYQTEKQRELVEIEKAFA